ncbi:MAG TPA: SWIM zinc finger family protein, partial [Anaerolineae bacterium]|nr:SWIM zinc finger family protein [Anaerolineae bacterium]
DKGMTLPQLTEGWIRQQANESSFAKGERYYLDGAVLEIVRRGDLITAEVRGSAAEPYHVTLQVDDQGIVDATCTCLYDEGGWCKHRVAVALTLLHKEGSVVERESLETLLQDLDAGQLRTLLRQLAARQPFIVEDIEALLPLVRFRPIVVSLDGGEMRPAGAASVPLAPTPVPPTRRSVQSLLGSNTFLFSYPLYQPNAEEAGPGDPNLYRAWALIRAGEGEKALPFLETATKEQLRDCFEMGWDDEGDIFEDFGLLWPEAILSARLDAGSRRAWSQKLQRWQASLDDYGYGEIFTPALLALEQGWEYPPLLRVLAGEITELGAWEGEPPDGADELAIARLNVLERQGRLTEYLYLAEAEGQICRYLLMLARLDRVEELLAYVKEYSCGLDEAFVTAQALHEFGHPEEALTLAQYGLTLGPPDHTRAALAAWLCALAGELGRADIASAAAIAAFEAAPTLAAYQRALDLAGEERAALRQRLLESLRQQAAHGSQDIVEIFLYEQRIDDAIAALGHYPHRETLRLVADAAIPVRPEWVIQACRQRAESMMDGSKARDYEEAAGWLVKVRQAYFTMGRQGEWRQYLNSLLGKHARKYKLVPLLQALER